MTSSIRRANNLIPQPYEHQSTSCAGDIHSQNHWATALATATVALKPSNLQPHTKTTQSAINKQMTSYGSQDPKALQGIRGIFDRYLALVTTQGFAGFDVALMRSLQLVACSDAGTVAYTLLITPAFANINGVMHGGAAGMIFDMCTMTALGPLARPGYWEFMGGVTRSLSISYLRAVPVGVEVLIRAEVVQCGRTMAFLRGTMSSLDEKVVYCTAEHHKVYMPMKEEFRNVVVEWDGLWGDDREEKIKTKL